MKWQFDPAHQSSPDSIKMTSADRHSFDETHNCSSIKFQIHRRLPEQVIEGCNTVRC